MIFPTPGGKKIGSHYLPRYTRYRVIAGRVIKGGSLYMTRYLGRNEILNTKNNEFNSAAIFPVSHELPMLRCGQINVAGMRRRQETWK